LWRGLGLKVDECNTTKELKERIERLEDTVGTIRMLGFIFGAMGTMWLAGYLVALLMTLI
jgi:hypothetical protein